MRKRWIWCDKRNELVPAEEFYRPVRVHHVIGDSQEFRVPGSNVIVSGKRARREFMKRNGLEEVGNDKKGLEEECAKARRYQDESETRTLKAKLTEVLRDREFFRGR
jgi:hypothetical protein